MVHIFLHRIIVTVFEYSSVDHRNFDHGNVDHGYVDHGWKCLPSKY